MRGKNALTCIICGIVLAALNSGCALRTLKEANQRLKESRDRLISENNRLEHELAALQRQLQDLEISGTRPSSAKTAASPSQGSEILPEMAGDIHVVRDEEGIHVRIPDRIFFGLGQAKLTRKGQSVLSRLGQALSGEYGDRLIRVEGHTDDIPVRKVRHIYPSNWELSTARACTVVRYLVDKSGISPQRIYPTGFAYYRPVAEGKSASARSQNRRVEITILNRRA